MRSCDWVLAATVNIVLPFLGFPGRKRRNDAHDCALSHSSAALESVTGQLLDESLGLFEKLSEIPRLLVLPMKDPRRDNRCQGSFRSKHRIRVQDVINVLAALERWIHNNPVELLPRDRWIKLHEVATGKMGRRACRRISPEADRGESNSCRNRTAAHCLNFGGPHQ